MPRLLEAVLAVVAESVFSSMLEVDDAIPVTSDLVAVLFLVVRLVAARGVVDDFLSAHGEMWLGRSFVCASCVGFFWVFL